MFLTMEIKREFLVGFATAAVLAAAAPAGAAAGTLDFGSTPEQQRAAGEAMGKEAYTYGYPLNEFNLVRKADLKLSAPLNVLANAQQLATPAAQGVVAPNTDTLYSLAQIDLGKGPVVLKVPEMDHGLFNPRYWTFEFVEPYTNVVGYIGSRLLDLLSAGMTDDPPPARDAEIVARMRNFGIGAGLKPSTAGLPAPVLEGLAAGVDAAAASLPTEARLPILTQAKENGGWYDPSPKVGRFGTDYQMRARVALVGIGINTVEESTYPTALTDSAGDMLNGANSYRMVFKRGKLPPVKGFWSVTMYDSSGYLVPNAAKIYAVGPDHPGMITRKDGSVVIVVQKSKPTEKDVNWLPSPEAGFRLNMRLYVPSKSILNGTWKPPGIEKVG